MTFAPSHPSRFAIPCPIPELAPVKIATLPRNPCIISPCVRSWSPEVWYPKLRRFYLGCGIVKVLLPQCPARHITVTAAVQSRYAVKYPRHDAMKERTRTHAHSDNLKDL